MRFPRALLFALPLAGMVAAGGTPAATAVTVSHRPLIRVGTNQSTNWSGYNQGTVEQGSKLFNSVSGDWVVPTATRHKAGEDEYSSTWIGIGGGCIDAGCIVGDNTLIQAGTEQDVAANGTATYSAWWELIPAPSITISNLPVKAGDKIHADITEVVANSNVWTITLKNLTTGKTFTQTTPYSSSHATAEWIEETPLLIGGSGTGFSALPKLTTVRFNNAKTNGANAKLKPAEEMQLIDANTSQPLATPSKPDPGLDGFNDCSFASTCAAPTSN